MPNWTEQTLHLVGATPDIDRFIRTGFVRAHPRECEDLLHFRRLCPLKRGEPHDTYTRGPDLVTSHVRTRTQAMFSFVTAWDYPALFYERLPQRWPRLAFACSVNGEMGDFGGIIIVRDGVTENLVRDYDAEYMRRTHKRRIDRALRDWMAALTEGRDYRLMPKAPWKHLSIPFDAHFDDHFWFYFHTREEMARFSRRYKSSWAMRRVDDEWRRSRL